MRNNENNQKLQEVTRKTLEIVQKEQIIFPIYYKTIFCEKAKEHDLKIDDTFNMNLDFNIDKIILETEILEKTTDSLSDNLDKASIAIRNRDEKSLFLIQKEVEMLKIELSLLTNELYTDELTQINNRKWLFQKYLDKGENFKSDGTLIFIDLNDFKFINDTYGHIVGDKVLKVFSQKISKIKNSVPARLAGDEFLLFYNNQEIEEIKKELDDINEFFSSKKFKSKDSDFFKIHFSYGYAFFKKGEHFNLIIDLADKEMYEHKKIKKNSETKIRKT